MWVWGSFPVKLASRMCPCALCCGWRGGRQGTHAGARYPPVHTSLLSRFKYVIGIGVGAGAYVLAKFAVSLGLGWAGPELLSAQGKGKSRS